MCVHVITSSYLRNTSDSKLLHEALASVGMQDGRDINSDCSGAKSLSINTMPSYNRGDCNVHSEFTGIPLASIATH